MYETKISIKDTRKCESYEDINNLPPNKLI